MRYFKARLIEKTNALLYRIYVTDALYASNKKMTLGSRYYDIYERANHPQEVETRTEEDVITHLRDKLKELDHE